MSRYPPDHRDAVRARVVAAASEQLRGAGLAATGVRAMMQASGLTHGGFYGHFPSRAGLVAEAVALALATTRAALAAAADAVAPSARAAAIIDAYLSDRHLAETGKGCAAAAFAPEIAREDAAVRTAFTAGVEAIIALLANALPGGTPAERQGRAGVLFALMMGTLQLARATDVPATADRLLAKGRQAARLLAGDA